MGSSSTTVAEPVASTTAPTSHSTETNVPAAGGLPGFETVEIFLDGRSLLVALADTLDRRSQGLMGVTDLGDLDGMVFVLPEPSTNRFWMKDTLISLEVGFFATDGSLLGIEEMEPCTSDPCPTYGVEAPWQWAIEVPAGVFNSLPPDAKLDVGRDPFLPLIKDA
ncbi:MAG: DUF192 domain-containing protein [Acidimicrobiia bacterium]